MSDPTRFELDDRQRAMLAEMGVRVWLPSAPVAPAAVLRREPAEAPAPPIVPPPSVPSAVAEPIAPQAMVPAAVSGPTGVEAMDWAALEATVAGCQACALCESRSRTVFGVGDPQAHWMVVGEAPGEAEDQQGEPFVGQAGELLDNMLKAIGLDRQARGAQGVYLANAVKCRPPHHRNAQPEEVAQCEIYLRRQVALVQPKIILAVGRLAVQSLLQTGEPLGKLRGRVHDYQGVPVVVTYHPTNLLRNLPDKARAWADLCLALDMMKSGAR